MPRYWKRPSPANPTAGAEVALATGLTHECYIINRGDDPLLDLERGAYLLALTAAIGGLESARVVLAKARPRSEGAGRRRPSE
jgi:hypothetical protein